jgi:hypothetical protein
MIPETGCVFPAVAVLARIQGKTGVFSAPQSAAFACSFLKIYEERRLKHPDATAMAPAAKRQ